MHIHNCFSRCRLWLACCLLLSFSILSTSCLSDPPKKQAPKKNGILRDNTIEVLVPNAPGTTVYTSGTVTVDASNTGDGYVMVRYGGTNEKVKFQITSPSGNDYTYLITDYGKDAVYPLPSGNGSYTLTLLESVSAEKDLYAISFTQEISVVLENEFSPFLYPNHYVSFSAESASVIKGKELAGDCYSDLDVVTNIYNHVIKHVTYDEEKAQNVAYGYTPDPDKTLSSGKGICFDYAALMTAMLRSQRIPTKLEVGYAGELYHAWISCYVDEIGWVDNIIEFDGKSWSLMDPTLAANNKSSAVKEYIGDGSKYTVKYTY